MFGGQFGHFGIRFTPKFEEIGVSFIDPGQTQNATHTMLFRLLIRTPPLPLPPEGEGDTVVGAEGVGPSRA